MSRPLVIAVTSLALGLLVACGATTPQWYADRERTSWTLELVEAESGALLVQGTIHGEGPFLFALDPDSSNTVIDDGVARRLDLYSNNQYIRVVNQHDVSVPRKLYEVLAMDVGDLRVRNIRVLNAPADSLRSGSRRIDGVIGADLLSRSMVVRVDRNAGQVHLSLTGHEYVPPTAVAVNGWLHRGWFYVPVVIAPGKTVTLQVRLASGVSTLRTDVLARAGLPGFPGRVVQIDETGSPAELPAGGVATIGLDGLQIPGVHFYRHVDKRERDDFAYDGILGQDLLSQFDVTIDRNDKVLYLAPRPSAVARR